jgi:hypothetical protein
MPVAELKQAVAEVLAGVVLVHVLEALIFTNKLNSVEFSPPKQSRTISSPGDEFSINRR